MDHGDHGGHGGHGDMPMGPTCSMNMLWNTQIIDTCIVFPSWHIGSNTAFFFSFLAIVALGVFYEYLRVLQKSIDARIGLTLSKGKRRDRSTSRPSDRNSPDFTEEAGLLTGRVLNPTSAGVPIPFLYRALRALLYAATVFLSFFLMLVFMTYNAYLILAVVLGAGIGHFTFGGFVDPESLLVDGAKGMACH